MDQSPTSQPPRKTLPEFVWPVGFLSALFLINFMGRMVLAPLLPAMEAELGMGHAESGSLFLYLSLGYCLTLFTSGLVSSWLDHRRNIFISAISLAAALVFTGFSSGLWGLRLGSFFLGAAGGLYLPSGIAAITMLAPQRHWGKAMAIHEMAPNLAFFFSPLLAEALLPLMSWRGVLFTVAAMSAAIGLAYLRWGRGGRCKGSPPNPANLKELIRSPSLWTLGIIMGLGVGASMGVYTMMTLFLMSSHGLERTSANLLVGLSRVSGVGMAFVAGWASDRLGPKRALSLVLLATSALTITLGLAPTAWVAVLVFLQPMLAVCFFPPVFAAMSRMTSAAHRNLAVSLVVALGILMGAGVIPPGIGWLGELGHFGLGIAMLGGFLALAAVVVLRLRFSPHKGGAPRS